MAFLAVSAIASHCEEIKKDLAAAVAAEVVAVAILKNAETFLKFAGGTGIPWLINAALASYIAAYVAVAAIGAYIGYLISKLVECEREHGSENVEVGDTNAGGGCDSGSYVT